jgi:hypothetical protein
LPNLGAGECGLGFKGREIGCGPNGFLAFARGRDRSDEISIRAPSISSAIDGGAFPCAERDEIKKPEQPVERIAQLVFLCDHPKQSAYRFE